ncbi:MAG: P-type conjugative transfer protein TrbJ [Acidithiobacillus sp.]|nr:P-type conjugative transfer protein TrbJ [Acidithiobacillus sp.]
MEKKALVMGIMALFAAPAALAGTMIGGATLPEQIKQEITAGDQLAKAAEQVQNQLQMLLNEARNLENLPQNFEQQMLGEVQQLSQIVGQGQSLSYAGQNIVSQFEQEYPGAANATQNFGQYVQDYQNWNTTTNQDIQNALQQQQLDAQDFTTEDQAVQSALSASQSAAGRMQVLQAANQVASVEVKQLQHMQSTTMAYEDAQMAYEKQQKAIQNGSALDAANGMFSGGSNTVLP